MFIVIAYDIVQNRRRTRLMKLLKRYGAHVQKSVFECRLDERRFLELKTKIQQEIDPEQDRVRYYDLCARCQRMIEHIGMEDPDIEEKQYVVL